MADCPNRGIGIDSHQIFATDTALDRLQDIDPARIYLVQLSDFMWQQTRSVPLPGTMRLRPRAQG